MNIEQLDSNISNENFLDTTTNHRSSTVHKIVNNFKSNYI